MQIFLFVALLAKFALGDFYLQWPRGSNNRLDGESRDRRNSRRLFDSQNNGRGGYNRGTGRMYWYEGTDVPMVWTQDQSCADDEARCTYVIQYYCDEHIRDGWYTDSTMFETIPYPSQEDCRVDMRRFGKGWKKSEWEHGNCTFDYRYGQQEGREYYEECRNTQRNMGLFTADQRLRGAGAIYTKNNPDGTRHGYECPEEKDYYPYWNPSPWRDLAIITDQPDKCATYQEQSQNVMPRGQCIYSAEMHAYAKERRWTGYVPISRDACVDPIPELTYFAEDGRPLNLGTWEEVPSHGIDAPMCITPGHSRANTLSNGYDNFGFETGFNWTIPFGFTEQFAKEIESERCVIRIRHNTSSADKYFGDASVLASGLDHRYNSVDEEGEPDNSKPTQIPIWETYGLEKPMEAFDSEDDNTDFGHGYVFGSNPQVDIFGDLLPANKAARVYMNLAINTRKYPRVFQDRTHGFVVRKRPDTLRDYEIVNLSVKGKRGNVVQTWPAHEYDFQPSPLEVKSGALLHIQWNGANTNPRNNAGEGPQGFDRSNIVMLRPQAYPEATKMNPATGMAITTFGQMGRNYPGHFGFNPKNTRTPAYMEGQEHGRFAGWDWLDNFILALPPIYSGYFDFGLKQVSVSEPTVWNYMATRNNNFSNRSQKGKITVLPRGPDDGEELPPPALKSRDARLSIPGKAFIDYDRDERLSYTQSIEIEQGPCDDQYDSCWFKVWPRVMSMPGEKSTGWGEIKLSIYHTWKPLNFGHVYWAEYPGDTLIQMNTQTDDFSWGATGRAEVWMDQGGYYVVQNEVNMTAVGGTIVGVIVAGIIAFFLFKKFGCRFIGGKTYSGARDPLMETNTSVRPAVLSDAPAAATTAQSTSVQVETSA